MNEVVVRAFCQVDKQVDRKMDKRAGMRGTEKGESPRCGDPIIVITTADVKGQGAQMCKKSYLDVLECIARMSWLQGPKFQHVKYPYEYSQRDILTYNRKSLNELLEV
jgi:hypothetical protein